MPVTRQAKAKASSLMAATKASSARVASASPTAEPPATTSGRFDKPKVSAEEATSPRKFHITVDSKPAALIEASNSFTSNKPLSDLRSRADQPSNGGATVEGSATDGDTDNVLAKEFVKASAIANTRDSTASLNTGATDALIDAASTATAPSAAVAKANIAMIAAPEPLTVSKPTAGNVNAAVVPINDSGIADPAHSEAVPADAQATDALAAEALDATDGAFPSVADAIEASLDSMAPSSVTPSGVDSYVSTGASTGRKPGFQPASKAPLAMHIQGPATATTKPPPVTPSGSDSNTPSTVDYTVKSTRAATSGGVPGT